VTDKTYRVLIDGEQQGPVDEMWICVRLTSGELPPRTMVWCEGMAEWTPAEELEQFQGLAAASAAPPPAAPAPVAPPPIPPVSGPPPADDDDRTVAIGHGAHTPLAERSISPAEQRPGASVERVRSVSLARPADGGAAPTPEGQPRRWTRRERIVALSLLGGGLLLALVAVVPWFKKNVLGTCDEVFEDCAQRCDDLFDTYADVQKCIIPCQDELRQCQAVESPRKREP